MTNETEVTDEMLESGLNAFVDWEQNDYRLEDWVDEYAVKRLVRRILESCLRQPHQEVGLTQGGD